MVGVVGLLWGCYCCAVECVVVVVVVRMFLLLLR